MKVKFLAGSVALLITTPFVILVTSVPAVSQRTRLIPGPAVCAWALNAARLESQRKNSALNRKRRCLPATQFCLVMLRPCRSYLRVSRNGRCVEAVAESRNREAKTHHREVIQKKPRSVEFRSGFARRFREQG